MIAYLALIVAVVGMLLYALATNAKVAEIGRILFFCGALTFTLALGGHTARLL